MKTCSKCGVPKNRSRFSKNKSKSGGINSQCLECTRIGCTEWRIKNPGSFQEWSLNNPGKNTVRCVKWRKKHPKRAAKNMRRAIRKRRKNPKRNAELRRNSTYGITTDTFLKMVEEQGAACAICRIVRKLVIDHCHSTGKVRGLLCYKCNRDISILDASPQHLKQAQKYLTAGGFVVS